MFTETKELTVTEITTFHPCLVNWRARVALARERGEFSREDMRDAGGWNYCAVGEAHKTYSDLVPYHYEAMLSASIPTDPKLLSLGTDFVYAVTGHHFREADNILDLIETRLVELDNKRRSL